jgi:hypothetical protein
MASNKHAPKPGEEMQIGYAGKSCTITLARFCYAFLHGYASPAQAQRRGAIVACYAGLELISSLSASMTQQGAGAGGGAGPA